MKKLLFYIDKAFFHFGIANALQKLEDYELSVIYDLNHVQKEGFETQTIVKFRKTWFLQDKINPDSSSIDMEYLKKFEEKYHIDLWLLVSSERLFLDYNQYHNFSHDEILAILEKECKFYEKCIEEVKPDCLLIRTTDWHRNHLLALICNSQGINVLMLNPTRIAGRCSISKEFDKFDEKFECDKKFENDVQIKTLDLKKYDKTKEQKSLKLRGDKLNIIKKIELFSKYAQIAKDSNYKNFYENQGRSLHKVILIEGISQLRRKNRTEFLNKNSLKSIPKEQKFVYFPLHYEPERDILIDAPYYTDQLSMIKNISKSIPIEYKLFVKEHPTMRMRGWREIEFYKKIISLPNVELIHVDVESKEIFEKCSLVISINGTSSFEGLFYQKPGIVFVESSYLGMKGIIHVKEYAELSKCINIALKSKVNLENVNYYLMWLEKNTFEFDLMDMYGYIFDVFFYNRFFTDAVIPINKIKDFLKIYEKEFDMLSREHVKKINNILNKKS